MITKCTVCGVEMTGPKHRKYCSSKCKSSAFRKSIIEKTGKSYFELARSQGLCASCHAQPSTKGPYCESCKLKQTQFNKKYRKQYRDQVLTAYGEKCVCCGEANKAFLTIDHINNNGRETKGQPHRGGNGLYVWLIKNNFPKTNFQLLCFNCNMGKGIYGICPHHFPTILRSGTS